MQDKMERIPKDHTKAAIISTIIMILLIISISFYLFNLKTMQEEEDCIERGSSTHLIRYASDKPIAEWILRNNHSLGPYFDYRFCDEE